MPWRRADYPADWCDVVRPAMFRTGHVLSGGEGRRRLERTRGPCGLRTTRPQEAQQNAGARVVGRHCARVLAHHEEEDSSSRRTGIHLARDTLFPQLLAARA